MTDSRNFRLEDGFVWAIFALAVLLIVGTVWSHREWSTAPSLSVITILILTPELGRQIVGWFRGAKK